MRIIFLLVIVTLTACTPPWKQAYQRGEQAVATARYEDAAIAFSESCDLSITDSDACVRADSLRRRVVDDALRNGEQACRSDLSDCLKWLQTARTLAVREPTLAAKVGARLDEASASHVARCMEQRKGSYAEIMIAARCAAKDEAKVGTAAHIRRVSDALAAIAQTLDSDVDQASFNAVRAGLAQCYAPTATRAHHTERMGVGTLDGLPPSFANVLCAAPSVTRAPIQCGTGTGMNIDVTGRLEQARVTYSTSRTNKSVRYVDWVEEKENPEHRRLQRRVRDLQDEHRRKLGDVDSAKVECSAAERALQEASYCYSCVERTNKDRTCDQERAADDDARRSKRALDDEESKLSRTDAVLRINHYADFDYVETRHTWEQGVRIEGTCTNTQAVAADRKVRFVDDTHVGFSRAGLAEDALSEPTGAMFDRARLNITAEELIPLVNRCVAQLADNASRCTDELDCHMRKSLFAGEDAVASAIEAFAAVVDKQRRDLPRFACR